MKRLINVKSYSKQLVKFIDENRNKYYTNELVILIKKNFNQDISTKALRKYYYRHNLTYKRIYNRKDKAIFARKIGFESPPDKNGLIKIKINDKQWQYKQRYLYEKYNNVKLSDDYLVLFADGNKSNFDKNNLIAVPKEVARTFYVMTHDTKIVNKNLTEIGLKIAELKLKTKDLTQSNE